MPRRRLPFLWLLQDVVLAPMEKIAITFTIAFFRLKGEKGGMEGLLLIKESSFLKKEA